MKDRIAKLISVKSLVTLTLTVGFLYLAIAGKLNNDYMSIYTMIIGFYFGTQATKEI